jgi:hypothetical protein
MRQHDGPGKAWPENLLRLAQPDLKPLRMDDMVARAFGKWLFYRTMESLGSVAAGAHVYVNIRGRIVKEESLELGISMVCEKSDQPSSSTGILIEDGICQLADRLAVSLGIDWSDKKIRAPYRSPHRVILSSGFPWLPPALPQKGEKAHPVWEKWAA